MKQQNFSVQTKAALNIQQKNLKWLEEVVGWTVFLCEGAPESPNSNLIILDTLSDFK